MENDVLDVGSLPTDPREMALRLLGMTAAELKSIDEKVVSGRNSVGGIRTDINKIVQDFNNIKPTTNTIPTQQGISAPPQPVQVVHQPITQPISAPAVVQVEEENKNQLEFDFYKAIKPEDLEYRLRLIEQSLQDITGKIDLVINIIKKNTQDLNGSHDE